jgi:hypothetical protein
MPRMQNFPVSIAIPADLRNNLSCSSKRLTLDIQCPISNSQKKYAQHGVSAFFFPLLSGKG